MSRVSLVMLVALLSASSSLAQSNSSNLKEARRSAVQRAMIQQVAVRGNVRFDEDAIKSWIVSRPGARYSPKRLDRDVRNLFNTGHFRVVKVFTESVGPDDSTGKIVTFEVLECPLVAEIELDASSVIDQPRIIERLSEPDLDLSEGIDYDPVKVRRSARVIEQMLRNNANPGLRVTPSVEGHALC